MEELSEKVRTRLAELSASFSRQLAMRLDEIRGLALGSDSPSIDTMRDLRTRVHRLCGSAATFGFDHLTSRLARIEQAVERCMALDPPRLSEAVLRDIDQLTNGRSTSSSVSTAADRSAIHASVDAATSRSEAARRVVVTLGDLEIRPEHYVEQLAVFGMSLVHVDAIVDVESYLSGGGTDGAEAPDHAILLVAVDYFTENPKRLAGLRTMQAQFGPRLVTVLVGQRDDFDTRLRSVRYGADIFLSRPVEIANLIDRIETVVGERVSNPYHILIIDDDPDQVSDTALALQQAGMVTSVVTDPRNLFQILVEQRPELILMDMYMPTCSGPELAAIIRQNEAFVGIPIVFLSVETDEERQLEAIQSGGDGFMQKQMDRGRFVQTVQARASRMRAMRFFMERDSLTGLLNHTNLKERLEHELQRARRMNATLVFAMIDLDRFKSVNDTYGHFVGDRVLKSLARLLQERLRRTDIIGRHGGEEFGVILFNTDSGNAYRIMDSIREGFSRIRHSAGDAELTVTLSCGIADSGRFAGAAAISEAADGALYDAKQSGRNQVIVAPDRSRVVHPSL